MEEGLKAQLSLRLSHDCSVMVQSRVVREPGEGTTSSSKREKLRRNDEGQSVSVIRSSKKDNSEAFPVVNARNWAELCSFASHSLSRWFSRKQTVSRKSCATRIKPENSEQPSKYLSSSHPFGTFLWSFSHPSRRLGVGKSGF